MYRDDGGICRTNRVKRKSWRSSDFADDALARLGEFIMKHEGVAEKHDGIVGVGTSVGLGGRVGAPRGVGGGESEKDGRAPRVLWNRALLNSS